ncbi:MAG: NAD-binding protein [Anaerolineae bacterium]|nr:NAD-binding protein [Anaerolineae bacterium]
MKQRFKKYRYRFRRLRATPLRWWRDMKRDGLVFVHLFPWRVTLLMLAALLLAAALFQWVYNRWQLPLMPYTPPLNYAKAVFAVINMTFFQLTFNDLPTAPQLDVFPFIVPLIGLPLVSVFGVRVIRVVRIFFLRAERGQEWQETLVRATVDRHILVCGLGRVGYRVAQRLTHKYGKSVVGINDRESPLVETLIAGGMPVILGNLEDDETLKRAGIERATVVIACTDSDWTNLETAVRARQLQPGVRVILRQFADDLTEEIQEKFAVDAVISRSAVAATTFVYAAIGGEIVETFELAHRKYVLARLPLDPTSPMLGRTIGEVAEERDVTVVSHHHGGLTTVEPNPATQLMCHDTLFIFTTVAKMLQLIEHGSEQAAEHSSYHYGAVLVCGLGNTGYRVAQNLAGLGCHVVAMDDKPRRLGVRLKAMGITVQYGDLRWRSTLAEAGAGRASAVVACTADDMTNLQVALQARALNPDIRVVIRIFDDKLAEQMRHSFGVNATVYSTSALAAPDFVAAALDRRNIRSVEVGHTTQAITRLQINGASLNGASLAALHNEQDVTILLHARGDQVDIPPNLTTKLQMGDEIVVMATEEKLDWLNRRNDVSIKDESFEVASH